MKFPILKNYTYIIFLMYSGIDKFNEYIFIKTHEFLIIDIILTNLSH